MKGLIKLNKCLHAVLLTICLASFTQGLKAQKIVDTTTIEQIMGMKGKFNNGEYKVTIPQNDLNVMVDGFR